jgi:hypothetical protein
VKTYTARRYAPASLAARPLPLALALLASLSACAGDRLIDQAHYEVPDARGIRVTQVLLRAADEPSTPDELDRVGYNRYAREGSDTPATTILVLVPEWGRGSGWLDGLARDLVVAVEGLEVWTLNRRQALLAALATPSAELDFLRRWDFALAQRDLAVVCDHARAGGRRLALGGWGLVGGRQAYERVASGADGRTALFLLDGWISAATPGERAALEGLRGIARAQLEAGALTAVGLDPRVRPSTPGDFGFAEQAAFEAERAPLEESALVDRHPALEKSQRRFTNRGLFAWAFDRPRPRRGGAEELGARGPLAGLQGVACAELERGADDRGPIDDARFGAECGAPYELEEALAPFSAPGGPFEAFAPLIGWTEALERTLAPEPVGAGAGFGPVLLAETSTQRSFLERTERLRSEKSAEDAPPPPPPFPLDAETSRLELELDGDEVAPLLAEEVRTELVQALSAWLSRS